MMQGMWRRTRGAARRWACLTMRGTVAGGLIAVAGCADAAAPRILEVEPLAAAASSKGGGYSVTVLGTLGGTYSDASDINEAGAVVGASSTASGAVRPFVWTASSGMVDLGSFGGNYSFALGINRLGEVVGFSTTPGGTRRAFFWSPSQGMVDLGTLGGVSSEAWAINGAGQVVGNSLTAAGETHAFRWTAAAGMMDLGTLGGQSSDAQDINESGVVTGTSTVADPTVPRQGFTWDARAGMRPVPVLLTAAPSGTSWSVNRLHVNDPGDLAAALEDPDITMNASLLVTKTGRVQTLAPLDPTLLRGTRALDLNRSRTVVGAGWRMSLSGNPLYVVKPVVWTPKGGLIELPTLIDDQTQGAAVAVNRDGVIAGTLTGHSQRIGAVVWRPTRK